MILARERPESRVEQDEPGRVVLTVRVNGLPRAGHVKIWDGQANEFIGESIETKTLPMDSVFSPDGKELSVV